MVIGRGLLAVCILTAAGAMVVSNVVGHADTAKPVMNAKAKRGAAIFQQNCVSCHNKQPDDSVKNWLTMVEFLMVWVLGQLPPMVSAGAEIPNPSKNINKA